MRCYPTRKPPTVRRDGTIRVYCTHDLALWRKLQQEGSLRSDPTLGSLTNEFGDAYTWMAEQMRARVPGCSVEQPWFAYANERISDVNHERWHYPYGTRHVRMVLDVPAEEVLLSDFHAWHHPLNGSPLALTEEEDTALDIKWGMGFDDNHQKRLGPIQEEWDRARREKRQPVLPEEYLQQRNASWEHIFDLALFTENDYVGGGDRVVQACFEHLRLDNVVRVTHFTGKDCVKYPVRPKDKLSARQRKILYGRWR